MARESDSKHRRGKLSADDAALFDASMRGVKALDRRASPPLPAAEGGDDAARKKVPARPREPVAKPLRAPLPVLAPGASADVDARTLERLRRGRLRPAARLDLHGMFQADAHRALVAFLGRVQARGLRCVLVVTGKGRVSEGGGVLRNQVPQWLNSPAIRPRILAFAPARPQDGGAGALYVLLRRVRPNPVRE
jgi:DNA-nicking Smr family endonuclease